MLFHWCCPLKKNSKYLMVGSIPTLHLKTFDQRERFDGKIKEKCSGKRNHKIFATTVLFLFRSVTPVPRKLDQTILSVISLALTSNRYRVS